MLAASSFACHSIETAEHSQPTWLCVAAYFGNAHAEQLLRVFSTKQPASWAPSRSAVENYATTLVGYNETRRSLSALPITETELKLIAAAASIGLSNKPKNGYRIPAAIGTPSEL